MSVMVARSTDQPGLEVIEGEVPGTILLAGELDMASADILAAALRVPRPAPAARVVVDLGGLTFMDMAGLRSLQDARRELLELGVRLVAQGATGEPARLLRLAGGF